MASLDAPSTGPLRHRLATLREQANRFSGERDAIARRENELIKKVGEAKGRLALKPHVDSFLEELQADAHAKSVGSYEALLSAIAAEVLDVSEGVGLELTTERGLPALDIFIDAGNGRKFDIVEGTGGSMTNVICLGLRMAATVRSGLRRFVALDEPDCWVKPTRVERFYNVVKRAADKLDIQSLVISHHEADLLPDSFSIVKLRSANGVVEAEADPDAPQWDDPETVGIRSIRLVDFMSHADTRIPLSPGVTALTGDNHIGKSVVMRALRAAFYGDVSDTDIRLDARKLMVEIEVEGGLTLQFSRQPGRNPVNEWALVDQDGELVKDEATNTEFRAGGRQPPTWVAEKIKIAKIEDLDPQLSHQKYPVFLLGQPAAKRAAVLSIGRESTYISSMITRWKASCTEDGSTIRNGEKEVAKIRERLTILTALDVLLPEITEAGEQMDALDGNARRSQSMAEAISAGERLSNEIGRLDKTASALHDLPRDCDDLSAAVDRAEEMKTYGRTLKRLDNEISAREKRAEIFEGIPPEPPELLDTGSMAAALQTAERLAAASTAADQTAAILKDLPQDLPTFIDVGMMEGMLDAASKLESAEKKAASRVEAIQADLAAAAEEMNVLLTELGNACPLCGSEVEDAESFMANGHSGHAA